MLLTSWLVPGWLVVGLALFSLVMLLVLMLELWPELRRRVARESPLEVAVRRYARGEMSRAEFDEVRRALGAPPRKPVHFAG